jgi:ABC-type dipeptide/oligopeptide/nickel transport system ATPase component
MSVLEIEDLRVEFAGDEGPVPAVAGVSLQVQRGEVVGLVGESGSGKSTIAHAVMGLLPPYATVSGRILFDGQDLTAVAPSELRRLRGDRVSMVVQDPLSALDPAFSIGSQVAETVTAHHRVAKAEARRRAVAALDEVGIPSAADRYGEPPHRFSGGMRQRVVIAAALVNEPDLLIADEPTTALDATIQAQILTLLSSLRDRHEMTMLLISHDLGVIARMCDRVGVLYAGELVESGPVAEVLADPQHPYTRSLVAARPDGEHLRGTLPGRELA